MIKFPPEGRSTPMNNPLVAPIVLTPEAKEALEKGRKEFEEGKFRTFDSIEEIDEALREQK